MLYRCRLCYGMHTNLEDCPYYKPELPEFSEVAIERAPATGQLHPSDMPPKDGGTTGEVEPEPAPVKEPKKAVKSSGSKRSQPRRKST